MGSKTLERLQKAEQYSCNLSRNFEATKVEQMHLRGNNAFVFIRLVSTLTRMDWPRTTKLHWTKYRALSLKTCFLTVQLTNLLNNWSVDVVKKKLKNQQSMINSQRTTIKPRVTRKSECGSHVAARSQEGRKSQQSRKKIGTKPQLSRHKKEGASKSQLKKGWEKCMRPLHGLDVTFQVFKFLCYFSQRRSLLSRSPYFCPLFQRFSLIFLPIRELRERFFSAWENCKRAAKRWKTALGQGITFAQFRCSAKTCVMYESIYLKWNIFKRILKNCLK